MKDRVSRLLFLLFLCALAIVTVAQVKRISQEPVTTTVANGDDFLINVQVGTNYTTRRISWSNMVAALTNLSLADASITNCLYVSTNGNDSWPGTERQPKLTPGAAISNAPNGSKIVFAPGLYTLDGSFHHARDSKANLNLHYRTNLWIYGPGATWWGTNLLSAVFAYQCSNVLFEGVAIKNDKASAMSDPEWLAASNAFAGYGVFGLLSASDTAALRLRDVHFYGSYDHGLLADSAEWAAYYMTNGCMVLDSTAEKCGLLCGGGWWDGAGFCVSAGWRVANCRVYDAGVAVEVYPYCQTFPSKELPAAIVTGCEGINCRGAAFQGDLCPVIFIGNSAWCNALSGYIGGTQAGLAIRGANRSVVRGNIVDGYLFGMLLNSGTTNVNFSGNTIRGGQYGFILNGALDDLRLVDNTFFGQSVAGGNVAGTIVNMVYADNVWRQSGTNNDGYGCLWVTTGSVSNWWLLRNRIENSPANNYVIRVAPKGSTVPGEDANGATVTGLHLVDNQWTFSDREVSTPIGLVETYSGTPPASLPFFTWPSTNVLWRLVKNITLTNAADTSACAYYPSNRSFFTIHNNNAGLINEWTLDGVCLRSITNPVAGAVPDCESITWMGGNQFALVDEDNNRIFIIGITNATIGWVTNNATIIQLNASIGKDGPAGVEGLAWDADRNGWWIVREKSPAQLMFCSADGSVTNNYFSAAQMQTFTNANNTDFSDIYYDRHNQMLWLTQDENTQYDRVLGISLLSSNVVCSINCTNFGQLEGISFTDDGHLLLAGEVNQFAILEPYLGGLNSGIEWRQQLTNAPSVPYFPNGVFSPLILATNKVTTQPTLALGSFAYWNSNGLMLWKCWNTNGSTVCIPTP